MLTNKLHIQFNNISKVNKCAINIRYKEGEGLVYIDIYVST